MVHCGAPTSKESVFVEELLTPKTLMVAVPALVMRFVETLAVSWVELM